MLKQSCAAFALLFATSSSLEAQGALSLQGLGFPPGQMSTRAEGSGGSTADFDALSVVNPASLAGAGLASLFLQYAPEFKRVTAGSGSATTTTARFPLVAVVIPMGPEWAAGLSSSTFLDRSFETRAERQQQVGAPTDIVTITERTRVLGAINDLRAAVAWSGNRIFRVGIGAHVFTGRNRVILDEVYPDSSRFISSSQETRVSYAGFAASAGIQYNPSRVIGFALSGRKGGDLRAESGDTALGRAPLPDRISAAVTYEGITGTTLSARISHEGWSSLGSVSSSIQAFDGWDASVGAEAAGPRVLQRIIMLRAGARFRTLPFGFNGEKVSETAFMGGLGMPLTRERASLDFAIQRAMRTVGGDAKERGLIFSFGLRVSP